jgi:tetratricopeptide (TPR) repeat protein
LANLFEHTDRRVVPNWRSFIQTVELGELNSSKMDSNIPKPVVSIDEYIFDWKANKNVVRAGDLLSAAIVNNKTEDKNVKDAANFILSNIDHSSKSQILLAERILDNGSEEDWSAKFNQIKLDQLPSLMNQELIREKIKEIKSQLISYLINPIHYVELSRYYSILGKENNAVKAMKTALHLAPNNRFVLRSATRLFIHYNNEYNDYIDYIHNILRKSPITNLDPWLISAEISISTIRNRNSSFFKKGIELINSKNVSPFNFTELASGLGTIELLNGNTKKSRELFNKSLISPNDNSLAQIEWASTKDKQLQINPANFGVKMNFEALALDSFHNSNFNLALDNSVKWFIDMPFSKRPIMFGSNLASTILKDQKKSISFLEAGLISHPNDPQLINNLAYALALDNRPTEAFDELNKIKGESQYDETTQICLTATRGLAYFRSGFYDVARELYLEAIDLTKQTNNQELNWIAILNYAREEIKINSEHVEPIMEAVNKIPQTTDNMAVRVLRQDVIKLYKDRQISPNSNT